MGRILIGLFLMVIFAKQSAFGWGTISQSIKGGDEISFSSNVENVDIYMNTRKIGTMNGKEFKYKLRRDGRGKVLQFKKSGYKTEEAYIDTSLDPLFWLNFIGVATFGSSTDSWSTKNSRQYTPNQFYIEMEKI